MRFFFTIAFVAAFTVALLTTTALVDCKDWEGEAGEAANNNDLQQKEATIMTIDE